MNSEKPPFDIDSCRRHLEQRERDDYSAREQRRLAALAAVRDAILSSAPRYPSVRRIWLFGSVVRPGAFRTVSDVDVAVEGVDARDSFALWRDIEKAAPGWTIDLRDTHPGSPFGERVGTRGLLVYEPESKDPQG